MRETGFYWVETYGYWQVAYWYNSNHPFFGDCSHWQLVGHEEAIDNIEGLGEINETKLNPKTMAQLICNAQAKGYFDGTPLFKFPDNISEYLHEKGYTEEQIKIAIDNITF